MLSKVQKLQFSFKFDFIELIHQAGIANFKKKCPEKGGSKGMTHEKRLKTSPRPRE